MEPQSSDYQNTYSCKNNLVVIENYFIGSGVNSISKRGFKRARREEGAHLQMELSQV